MLNQNYDPEDLVVDIKNVCSDYDSSVISSSIKVTPSREPLVKGGLNSEKFQNLILKPKLPLLKMKGLKFPGIQPSYRELLVNINGSGESSAELLCRTTISS